MEINGWTEDAVPTVWIPTILFMITGCTYEKQEKKRRTAVASTKGINLTLETISDLIPTFQLTHFNSYSIPVIIQTTELQYFLVEYVLL